MDLGIAGKVALVTGGARSLGRQDCLTLAAEGCRVIVLDLNGEGAAETAKEITDKGGQARGYEGDITNRSLLGDVIRRAESEMGPVDICVNNAGLIYTLGQLKDMDDAAWDLNLQVNLTGTYNVTKAVFPGMRERRWGRIISMSSIAGLMGVELEIETDGQRLRPALSEVERLWASNEKAPRLLDWTPAFGQLEGFKRGLSETIRWFCEPANLAAYKADTYNL